MPAHPIDRDLACAVCGYNLRTQPLDGRCPECGCDVGRSLAEEPTRFDRLLDRASWFLIASGVALTFITGAFDVACAIAGVTSEDLHSAPTTAYAHEFSWFYHRVLWPIPFLAFLGIPTCIAVAFICSLRNRYASTFRALFAIVLTLAYALLWG